MKTTQTEADFFKSAWIWDFQTASNPASRPNAPPAR